MLPTTCQLTTGAINFWDKKLAQVVPITANDQQSFRPEGEISGKAEYKMEISPSFGRRNDGFKIGGFISLVSQIC